MSTERFMFLIICLRFDDYATRVERRSQSKLPPIKKVWNSPVYIDQTLKKRNNVHRQSNLRRSRHIGWNVPKYELWEKTRMWLLCMLWNILNIIATNSYVIYAHEYFKNVTNATKIIDLTRLNFMPKIHRELTNSWRYAKDFVFKINCVLEINNVLRNTPESTSERETKLLHHVYIHQKEVP